MPYTTQNTSRGFTLVELLVVLVILGLTTSILISGLSIVWNSFSTLGHKQQNLSANLGISWLRKSVEGAVLYHPDTPIFAGDSTQFTFISTAPIDDDQNVPTKIIWKIEPSANNSRETNDYVSNKNTLVMENKLRGLSYKVVDIERDAGFWYLVNNEWSSSFHPKKAELPQAIKLQSNQQIMVIASPKRPLKAEVPAEMNLFGDYEF